MLAPKKGCRQQHKMAARATVATPVVCRHVAVAAAAGWAAQTVAATVVAATVDS